MIYRRPDGHTVRLPPAAGVAEAYRLHINGYLFGQIAQELTRQGYQQVTQGDTAKRWVSFGQKIAARRAQELSDPVTRRVEEIARYAGWLAELDAGVRTGNIKLDKAMPHRIRAAQEWSRAAAGIAAAPEQNGQLAGRYFVAVDQLEDITDRDVLVTYFDEQGIDPETQQA